MTDHAALRESDVWLQNVTENLTEGLVICRADGQTVHWNRAAIAMHGYSSLDECLRMLPDFATTFAVTTLEDEPLALEQWPLSRILRGERLRDVEVRIRRWDAGWERIFSYSGSMVEDPGTSPMAFVAITDVTDRQRTEQQLREGEARYRGTLDRMIEGCQIIGRDWRYLYVNDAAAAHGRRPAADLLGRTMMEVYPGIETTTVFAALRRCMEGGGAEALENVFSYPDGSTAIFELRAQPVPEGIFILSLDITERRHAEDALQQLNATLEHRVTERTEQLEAANKELEAFSYSISHDLRAPLRAIDGFSHLLLEDYAAQLPPEAQRHLQTIRDGAQRMGTLIDDLLEFARLSRLPLRKRPVAMGPLVRAILDELEPQRAGRQIELRVGDLATCEADPSLIRQVWSNLLGNALKYTSKRERAVVEVGCNREAGETVFHVRDNGSGFDMRYASKLFGVFQRLHRDDEFDGTGVGLAIVQRIVHRHGGRVWADAAVDRGATFHFTLPCAAPP